jgi:hypothetical protein
MQIVATALLCCLLSPVAAPAATRDTAFFLRRLAGEDVWLAPLPDESVYLASSNQPVEKRDCNAFQYTEKEGARQWKVLLDVDGPGVVTRFWAAGDYDGALEFWIDGQRTVSTTLADFFSGKCAPCGRPLVADQTESSGGRVSYFPIPFANHIKVRGDSDSDSFYWQINYSLFKEPVVSFAPQFGEAAEAAFADAARFLERGPSIPENAERLAWEFGESDVCSAAIPGAGMLRELTVTMSKESWGRAGATIARVYADEDKTPCVEAGLLDLAHLGSRLRPYRSAYSRFDGETLTIRYPMPFSKGLRIHVDSGPISALGKVTIRAVVARELVSTARFHARTTDVHLPYGHLVDLLRSDGAGVFVGFNLLTQAPDGLGFFFFNQEGNEYIWVDGAETPVWKGTGTEDYFNCGYYYREGEVALPLHGCLDKREIASGRASAYRIQKLDAVPFKRGIRVALEPGCPKKGADLIGKHTLHYRWTTFWYLQRTHETNRPE